VTHIHPGQTDALFIATQPVDDVPAFSSEQYVTMVFGSWR